MSEDVESEPFRSMFQQVEDLRDVPWAQVDKIMAHCRAVLGRCDDAWVLLTIAMGRTGAPSGFEQLVRMTGDGRMIQNKEA